MIDPLFLYQLADSNLPIGSFSHSYGFETYLQKGAFENADDFRQWIETYIRQQLLINDGLAIRQLLQTSSDSRQEQALELTELLHAATIPEEIRIANQQMGRQFLKLCLHLTAAPVFADYQADLKKLSIPPHPAIVFALSCGLIEAISPEDGVSRYCYSACNSLIQNGVRGIPLGQIAGQQLLFSLLGKMKEWTATVMEMSFDRFGAAAPALEIAQMQHQYLFARNFMT